MSVDLSVDRPLNIVDCKFLLISANTFGITTSNDAVVTNADLDIATSYYQLILLVNDGASIPLRYQYTFNVTVNRK